MPLPVFQPCGKARRGCFQAPFPFTYMRCREASSSVFGVSPYGAHACLLHGSASMAGSLLFTYRPPASLFRPAGGGLSPFPGPRLSPTQPVGRNPVLLAGTVASPPAPGTVSPTMRLLTTAARYRKPPGTDPRHAINASRTPPKRQGHGYCNLGPESGDKFFVKKRQPCVQSDDIEHFRLFH